MWTPGGHQLASVNNRQPAKTGKEEVTATNGHDGYDAPKHTKIHFQLASSGP
eukprot:TRINITY_DN8718_c0_g1_i3.p3 TRINITY_DN8718_c0_g1~~TRINITY_DN8718_c0_g1_i3.p3  ORF type:complete len:52 (+),score=2.85 TRINITY_DN8718_c0_g1_i3:77-232(+)